MITKTMCQLM